MNALCLYAFTICSLRSVRLTVDARSILPAANRLSMIVGMLKLTASRMWQSEKSMELRQSSMSIWHLLLEDSSVANQSQPTQILDNNAESSSAGISNNRSGNLTHLKHNVFFRRTSTPIFTCISYGRDLWAMSSTQRRWRHGEYFRQPNTFQAVYVGHLCVEIRFKRSRQLECW